MFRHRFFESFWNSRETYISKWIYMLEGLVWSSLDTLKVQSEIIRFSAACFLFVPWIGEKYCTLRCKAKSKLDRIIFLMNILDVLKRDFIVYFWEYNFFKSWYIVIFKPVAAHGIDKKKKTWNFLFDTLKMNVNRIKKWTK